MIEPHCNFDSAVLVVRLIGRWVRSLLLLILNMLILASFYYQRGDSFVVAHARVAAAAAAAQTSQALSFAWTGSSQNCGIDYVLSADGKYPNAHEINVNNNLELSQYVSEASTTSFCGLAVNAFYFHFGPTT